MYGTGATRLAWVAGAIVAFVLLFDVLLLAFAGVLLAVALRMFADALSSHARISARTSLLVVIVALAAALALAGWKVGPDIAREVDQLVADAPALVDDATSSLESYTWGRWFLEHAGDTGEWLARGRNVRRAATAVGTVLGLVGTGFVILLVGLFVAAEPSPYGRGLLRLVPVARRDGAATLLGEIEHVLRSWLLGKLIAMLVIFGTTWLGLALLGIPIALTLALLAAALTFIPNFGPILAAVPAILLGLRQGTPTALAVAGLYAGAQALESYVLTPLIQRKTTSLPPALTLVAQVAMGLAAGGLGLLLATPATAVVLTIARRLTPPVEDEPSSSAPGT